MSNKVYIVIIVLLLGIVGWMAYSMNEKEKQIVYVNQEKGTVMDEREGLEVELEAMKMKYDTITVTNADMQSKIDQQLSDIEALQKKAKNKDYDISKLRAEAGTLRDIMKNYIHQIDSLNQANQQLTIQRDAEAARALTAETRGQELEGELTTTKDMVSKGSVLTTGEYQNTGVFDRNSGKQVDTDRASKTEMIKSCFKVRKNQIAKPGVKTLYMSVVGPDGKTLTGKTSGMIMVDGAETPYSVTRDVDYQQQDADVCVYYTAPEGYEYKKGNYKIMVYESGVTIGSSSVSLK